MIRISDLFVEFEAKQSILSYTGSITDQALVQQACRGVDIVLHIASMIDWSLFPNRKILHEVNILGKITILLSIVRVHNWVDFRMRDIIVLRHLIRHN